jgi:hypothetical protein
MTVEGYTNLSWCEVRVVAIVERCVRDKEITWKEIDQPQSQSKQVSTHDITPRRRPTISPNDHASFKLNSHNGCLYISCVLYSAQSSLCI